MIKRASVALLGLSGLFLCSCMTKLDIFMWYTVYGNQPEYGEPTKKVRGTIVATAPGANHGHFSDGMLGMQTSFSSFCKILTEDGSTYKADLMPCVRYSGYYIGDKGVAEIGLESDALHSFIPDRYAEKVEREQKQRSH